MNKHRGYFKLPVSILDSDGKIESAYEKNMHFSVNFIANLQSITEQDLTTWLSGIEKGSADDQSFAICQIVFSALAAYDQEQGNEINYNVYQIRNWVTEAIIKDPEWTNKMMEVMVASLGYTGK